MTVDSQSLFATELGIIPSITYIQM